MGDENIIANVIMDFFVIVIIFIYSFIIKLDSGNNSSSGKNNSSGNNSSSNLSIFEKEYTDILKNIIKLFKTEANIFSPFLFSYLTFFFYISTISKKYNIYEYLFICLFIILIPILLVGLILFITGFFSYINSAVLDEVSNNIYKELTKKYKIYSSLFKENQDKIKLSELERKNQIYLMHLITEKSILNINNRTFLDYNGSIEIFLCHI